jgi:CRISPR-associated protein Cst1
MGITSLLAFAGREEPGDLTFRDLEKFARYAEEAYFSPELASYLTVLFTSNFINPSFTARKKKEFVQQILAVHKAPPDPALPGCAYCGRPSVRLAHRDLVPMLTGRQAVNFFPEGAPGLALCGHCILALQALAIGSPMCSGRALIVSCDSPTLTLELVKGWQPAIRKRVQLSQQTKQKLPPLTRPLTRTVEALGQIEMERSDTGASSVTVYHLSNSGQRPQADVYFLPSSVVRFVRKAKAARYAAVWQELARRAWEVPAKPKKGERTSDQENKRARNYLYEDLFGLPDRTPHFVRVYFLRRATQFAQGAGDPRRTYGGWEEHITGLWDLTRLFLQEVIAMDSGRIEAIRKVGDTLAEEIASENDRRLWGRIYRADAYWQTRKALILASQRRLHRGLAPVLSLEEFLRVFEEGEELPRVDWRLAWDLVLIRVIEKLHEAKWFERNRDILEEQEEQLEVKEA